MYPSFITNNNNEDRLIRNTTHRYHLDDPKLNIGRSGATALFSKIDISRYYIEIGAVQEILNLIRECNFKAPFIHESFHEVVTSLQTLLAQIGENAIEEFLSKNSSLRKCALCGVISHSAKSIVEKDNINLNHKDTNLTNNSKRDETDTKEGQEKVFSGFIRTFLYNGKYSSSHRSEIARDNDNEFDDNINNNVDRKIKRGFHARSNKSINTIEDIHKNETISNEKMIKRISDLKQKYEEDKFVKMFAPFNHEQKVLYQSELDKNCLNITDTIKFLIQRNLAKTIEKERHTNSQINNRGVSNSEFNYRSNKFSIHENCNEDFTVFNEKTSNFAADKKFDVTSNKGKYHRKQLNHKNVKNSIVEEEDSLENCASDTLTQISDSSTTVCDTSSANKIILMWLNPTVKTGIINEKSEKSIYSKETNDKSSFDFMDTIKMRVTHSLRKNQQRFPDEHAKRLPKQTKSFLSRSNVLLRLSNMFKRTQSKKLDDQLSKEEIDDSAEKSPSGTSKHFESQMNYNNETLRKLKNKNNCEAAPFVSIYKKLLESNQEVNWHTFQQLVGDLHPNQRDLWNDICTAINNEAKRVAMENGTLAEVCIEITPVSKEEEMSEVVTSANEIIFEMDIVRDDQRGTKIKVKRGDLKEKSNA